MTNADLNEYIKYYVEHDQTRRAIMLTGGWGSGKSYYIQNELIPFLAKEENGKHQCIIISLYGIKEVSEIGKDLCFEFSIDMLNRGILSKILPDEIGKRLDQRIPIKAGSAKTVLREVLGTAYFEKHAEQLLKVIDFTGKLIVLEDIERSTINLLDVLGYVNRFVEQDGTKVMLVANEDEIIKYHNSEPDEHGRTHRIYDESTLKYLQVKEKTICDTISFTGDSAQAMRSILQSFHSDILSSFSTEEALLTIEVIHTISNSNSKLINLRTFIYTCQKTIDICEKLVIEDSEHIANIYFSVFHFSEMIQNNGTFPEWEGDELLSTELGTLTYPLYRFCYDYIRWQQLDIDVKEKTFARYTRMRLYDPDRGNKDNDLMIIYSYNKHYENELFETLKRIESRLDKPKDIPLYSYGKLAYYMVKLHALLDYDYTECKAKMVRNICGEGDNIDPELLFMPASEMDDDVQKELYTSFSREIIESMNSKSEVTEDFSYNPNDIRLLYLNAKERKSTIIASHAFICKFDLIRLVNMLFLCSPSQLSRFRDLLFMFYRHAKKDNYLEADRIFMGKLKNEITARLDIPQPKLDRVVRLQLDNLVKNLNQFITQLS